MTRLSEDEAWKFLQFLARVSKDMDEAMSDIDRLPDEEFDEKWGVSPSQVEVEVGRDNYREFTNHAYFDESELRTASSECDDWDESTPTDAGVSLFGDMNEFLDENQDADEL